MTRGRLLQVSDPQQAKAEWERSLELQPSCQTLAILLSLHLRHDWLDEAQKLIDFAAASQDRTMTITPFIANKLRAAGLRLPSED